MASENGREIDREVIQGRYDWVDQHAESFLREKGTGETSLTDRVDRVLLHPTVGFLVFLLAMGLVFQTLFTGADPAIDASPSRRA